nr:hypothetical protein [Tanacetum cinerariifolium]
MNSLHLTQYQLADIFTKPLDEPTFKRLIVELGVNTYRNAIGAHYLPHFSKNVAPPSIDIVRPWFETIRYGEDVPAKRTLKNSLFPPRMHKEDQQTTGGPTSLGVTSEARANPQLSSGNDALTASTTKADPENSAPSDFVPQQHVMNEGTKKTSYDHLFAGTDLHVLTDQTTSVSKGLETVLTQPIIGKRASSIARQIKEETFNTINDEDEDDEVYATKNVKTKDTSVPKSSSPSSLPTKLKDLPSKFDELTKEVKGLKKQVHELEIELPGDLKEIPTKLEDFTKTVTSLTSQVTKSKTLQWELPMEFLSLPVKWELPMEFLSLPVKVVSVQAKLKTLDALPGLLLNVTKALNKFTQVLDYASSKARDQSVPSAGQADTRHNKPQTKTTPPPTPLVITTTTQMQSSSLQPSPKGSSQLEGEHIKEDKGKKALSLEEVENENGRHIHLTEEEVNHQKKLEEDDKAKAAKQEGEVKKAELVNLLGPEVVKKYYNDKLQYDRYCDKMLNKRAV